VRKVLWVPDKDGKIDLDAGDINAFSVKEKEGKKKEHNNLIRTEYSLI
jgi:hypothetical protein